MMFGEQKQGKWLRKIDKGNQIVRKLLNNDKYKGRNLAFFLIKYKRASTDGVVQVSIYNTR